MDAKLPATAVAEHLVERIVKLKAATLPPGVKQKCEDLLIDVVGLCVTARNEDYTQAAINGCDDDGPCTAIGHARTLSAASAAYCASGPGWSSGGVSVRAPISRCNSASTLWRSSSWWSLWLE